MRALPMGSRSAFSHASNSAVRKKTLILECIQPDTKNQVGHSKRPSKPNEAVGKARECRAANAGLYPQYFCVMVMQCAVVRFLCRAPSWRATSTSIRIPGSWRSIWSVASVCFGTRWKRPTNEGGRLSSMESWTIAGKHDRRLMVDLEIRCYRGNVQP